MIILGYVFGAAILLAMVAAWREQGTAFESMDEVQDWAWIGMLASLDCEHATQERCRKALSWHEERLQRPIVPQPILAVGSPAAPVCEAPGSTEAGVTLIHTRVKRVSARRKVRATVRSTGAQT